MFVLMGLGNPGSRYERTRHNAGFDLLDFLGDSLAGGEPWKSEHRALTRKVSLAGETVLLAKPQTFMNLSGESARPLLSFYKCPLSRFAVVADDVALPLGAFRIRGSGSHGGHNGLRNLILHLGDGFTRIRIGVGLCPPGWDLADFVLKRYGPDEETALAALRPHFKEAVGLLLSAGWEKAAGKFNRGAGGSGGGSAGVTPG